MDRSLRECCPPVVGGLGEVATARLLLRPMEPGAVDLLAPVFEKPEVWRFPYGRGFTRAETEAFVTAQVEHWETLRFGLWVVSEQESGLTVGYVGLSVPTFFEEVLPAVEVGWRLDPDVWGRGYAIEAAEASLAAGFDTLRLSRIVSLPQTENSSSVRVAEGIGMREERRAIVPATDQRGPVEVAVMEITERAWTARRAPR